MVHAHNDMPMPDMPALAAILVTTWMVMTVQPAYPRGSGLARGPHVVRTTAQCHTSTTGSSSACLMSTIRSLK